VLYIQVINGKTDYSNFWNKCFDGRIKSAPKLPFWDGKASGRIIDILEKLYGQTTHKTEA